MFYKSRLHLDLGNFCKLCSCDLCASLLVVQCLLNRKLRDSLIDTSVFYVFRTRIVRNGFLNFSSGSVLKKTAGLVSVQFCEKTRFRLVSAIIYKHAY